MIDKERTGQKYEIPTEQTNQRTAFSKTYTVTSGKSKAFVTSFQIHAFDTADNKW